MDTNNLEPTQTQSNTNNYQKFYLPGAVILVLVALAAGSIYALMNGDGGVDTQGGTEQVVSASDPLDIVLNFYGPWLEARQSTSTDPYALQLGNNPLLSESLRQQLMTAEGRAEGDIDPVLCQTTVPESIRARMVSESPDLARVLVNAKDKTITAQSVATLKRFNDGWYIDSIACAPGEFEEPREFSFEREGNILKQVPAPYNPEYWHIVFEENGIPGHAAALFFGATSTCTNFDGSEAVCDPAQFIEGVKIRVVGQMTETGVDVVRLEFKN
jgi:hypothetical protein